MTVQLMEQLVLIVHLLLALAIIGLIMLQQGKGADMGASFGAGASQTLFGSSGSANVLTRTTAWMVALFFASSFGLAVMAKQKSSSVDDLGIPIPAARELPVDELPSADSEVPSAEAANGELPTLDAGAGAVPAEGDLPAVDAAPIEAVDSGTDEDN